MLSNMGKSRIEISAEDHASGKMDDVTDKAKNVSGLEAQVDISASDNATQIVDSVKDRVNTLGGTEADAEIGVDDNASPVVDTVKDKIEGLGGVSGTPEIGVDDNASPVVDTVKDKIEGLGGVSGTSEINAHDVASPIIDAAMDKAASWAGKTFSATISVVDAVTSPLDKIGSVIENPIAQVGTVAGVSFGIADSVNTYKDFEAMMSQVKAISGATGSDFTALTQKAQQMGASTKFTATESAEAFNYMAMAGWKTGDMLNGIEGIMSLAAASGESLGTTSDIVTDALTAFGLKASDSGHFADVLAQASANANTNVGMLGESFKYVAPVAGAMNYNVEDVSLALGLMANASVKSSMAGTALKTSIANLVSPTDNMAAAMEKYGICITKENGEMKSLGEVITNLRSSLGGLSEDEQTAAASTIFGKEAMAGMLAIINASEDDYNKLSKAIYNADGASQRMAETMLDNLSGSFTLLQSAVDGVKNTLGESASPYLRSLADWATQQMPGIEDGIEKLSARFSGMVSEMTGSEEWKNTDFLGKVNIAWDKLVGEPFMEWAGTDGIHVLSEGLASMFESVGKTVTGQGGIADWLETALLAKGAIVATKGISGLASVASTLSPAFGTAIPVVAGVAAAIGLVSAAVDAYNTKQVNKSLEEHFGAMELSAKELVEVADHIIDADYLVHANAVLENVDGIELLRDDIESKLKENDKIVWKSSIGMEITDEEVDTYIANEKSVIKSKLEQLEQEEQTAKILIHVAPNTETSRSISSQMDAWIKADNLEFSNLSSQITEKLSQAFHDGIADMDILSEVDALQAQMDELLNAWNVAQSQAAHDMLEMKFGTMSAEQLSAGGFSELIGQIHTTLTEDQAALDGETSSYLALLHSWENSGKISSSQRKTLQSEWTQAERNERGTNLANAVDFETNTLNNTYGEQISKSLETVNSGIQSGIAGMQGRLQAGQNGMLGMDMLDTMQDVFAGDGSGGLFGIGANADQTALNGIWQQMQPDAQMLTNLMDEYVSAGQAIPTALKNSFMQAMEVGAAAGDETAAWQMYANSVIESGDQALIDAVNEADIMGNLPEEFSKAWKRAAQEVTDEPLELSGAKAKLNDMEIDSSDAQSAIEEAITSLTSEGAEFSITADGVTIDLSNIDIDSETAMAQIEAALGMETGTLGAAGISVESGASVTVPSELVAVDTSGIETAIAENMSGETETSPVESNADVKMNAGNVDPSSAIEEATTQTQEAFSTPIEAPGNVNATLTQTNNVDAIYSEVDGQVQGTFAVGYSTTADVAITLSWHITNPSASIGVSSSGMTATASITGYANGGFVDEPTFLTGEDGPEFVIPVGAKRRNRGLALWRQAGEALGAFGNLDIPQYADGGFVGNTMPGYASEAVTAAGSDYSAESEDYSKYLSGSGSQGNQGAGPVSVPININLSPTFEVSGGKNQDDDAIVEIIRKHLAEMVDEIGDNFAELLEMVFGNMPLAGGA